MPKFIFIREIELKASTFAKKSKTVKKFRIQDHMKSRINYRNVCKLHCVQQRAINFPENTFKMQPEHIYTFEQHKFQRNRIYFQAKA